jgi:hypothetical protein
LVDQHPPTDAMNFNGIKATMAQDGRIKSLTVNAR